MAVKNSDAKKGSGNQDSKQPPEGGAGKGGKTEENEEEEPDEGDDAKDSKDGDGKGEKKDEKKKDDELDLSSLPESAQKHIKDLRRESAKYRTKASNLEQAHSALTQRVKSLAGGKDGEEDDDTTPEQRLERLEGSTNALSFDNAILQSAVEHGISKDGLKYFRFLVQEKVAGLEEGEELSEEDLEEIAAEASKATGSGRQAKTSVTDADRKKAGGDKKPGDSKAVTLDQFLKMSVSQKSDFQRQNADLYAALFKQAVNERKF